MIERQLIGLTEKRLKVMRMMRQRGSVVFDTIHETHGGSDKAARRFTNRLLEKGWIKEYTDPMSYESIKDVDVYELSLAGNAVMDAIDAFREEYFKLHSRDVPETGERLYSCHRCATVASSLTELIEHPCRGANDEG